MPNCDATLLKAIIAKYAAQETRSAATAGSLFDIDFETADGLHEIDEGEDVGDEDVGFGPGPPEVREGVALCEGAAPAVRHRNVAGAEL